MKDYQALWAKKEEKNGKFYWLPLTIHLTDTMDVCGWLWNHWLSDGQRRYLISQMKLPDRQDAVSGNGETVDGEAVDEEIAEALVRFLGGVHDMGKATPAFQAQKGFMSSPDLDSILLEQLEAAGFTGISSLELASARMSHHALAGEILLHGFGVRDDIASIVGGHHGSPLQDREPYLTQKAYRANYYQSENVSDAIAQKWKGVQEYFFHWALDETGMQQDGLPEISEPGQVLLSGLVIMADWIASNERYFPLFPTGDQFVTEDEYLSEAERAAGDEYSESQHSHDQHAGIDYDRNERFASGMQKWLGRFPGFPLDIQELPDCDSLYMHRFGFRATAVQKVIYQTVETIHDPGILVIEAPTGCGKTEAALAAAEQLAAKCGRSGLFFGLPTQATSNGIFGRILNWTESLAHDYGNVSIRLVHGKAALNPLMAELRSKNQLNKAEKGNESLCGSRKWNSDADGSHLRNMEGSDDCRHNEEDNDESSNVDEDESENGTVSVNEWFSGRKQTALDDFVVGTVDQFLLAALKQKHLALRHLGFSRKIIVIDEVHAYDAYMLEYLQEALRWMGAYRVPVILLSATLPADTRTALVQEYLKGRGVKKPAAESLLSGNNREAYPVVTYSDGETIKQNTGFPEENSRTVSIQKLDENDLYRRIRDRLQNGGVAGIIVNTVKRAQQVAQQCSDLFGAENVILLHSGYIAADRIAKETQLLSMIGKGAQRPGRKIIVGTQVLEQSLDIDFDILFTDLCPMDLLIQRIGRLQRHPIRRPDGLEQPIACVMGTSEDWNFEPGTSYIYGDYLLVNTQLMLPEQIRIPEDVPHLVQSVYEGFEAEQLTADSSLQNPYNQLKEQYAGQKVRARKRADAFRLGDPKLRIRPERHNLIGWLKTPSEADSEEMACAQVRDTVQTVEVIAVRKKGTGYSTFLSDEDISGHLDDPETARSLAQQTLRLPVSLTSYDRINAVIRELEQYNIQHFPDWQSSPWLKGSLGILFDENNRFSLCGKSLYYDSFLGLRILEENA